MTGRRRVYRVAEKIRELIASKLCHTADPRFAMVTITSAAISADLGEAKIYWNINGGPERAQAAQSAFESAVGFFRSHLAKELGLRTVPRLRFYYDDTLDTVAEVERLFERLSREDKEGSGSQGVE
ncbi:MAG: 30S ribosome-binding factor RbfA [Deltaproteobacteria bacterium]|nr:30S ribosome-binding factor RbfA [Deltaproteobacteria bacterium]